MKKALSLLLAFVMLLSLCACGNSNNQNTEPSSFSQNTTGNTEDSTQETTEATQATTEESTTASTEEPTTAPIDEMDTKPADTSKPTHTHSYSAATCTQPKKCSCGATNGSALGHTWTPATCTVPKTCSVCKATEGSAVGHKWANATCSTPKTCSVCKATEGNAAGHNWSKATCTVPKTCTKCNATEGIAAGHSWSNATCQAPKTCSVCQKTEGNKAEHLVEGTTCKWCKNVVVVDPGNFNANINYTFLGERFSEAISNDCYVWTILDFQNTTFLSGQTSVHSESDSPVDGDGRTLSHHHNGKYYYNIAQVSDFGGETTYKIVGAEIVAYFASEGEKTANTIHFVVLSDGTLKVTAFYGAELPEKAKIPVGSIFYPNEKPYPRVG